MPVPASLPTGAPCWIDLFTSDPDASRAFYGELLGWSSVSAGEEYGGYINFSTAAGAMVAGAMRNDGSQGVPDTWSVYLASTDARATVEAARAAGGQVHLEAMDVAELGAMAMVADPGGAAIGVWQPKLHQGFGVLGEVGAPAHFELHTRDYDACVEFYKNAFGWNAHTMSDTPEFRYTTYGEGDDVRAGIMDSTTFLPEGVPAHWRIYLQVQDTDATLARAVELGGSVLEPAVDTPYGRLGGVTDPTGATFAVMQAS